nr:MAG TPA: hypothetical protein [Caudoviricetes sp.]
MHDKNRGIVLLIIIVCRLIHMIGDDLMLGLLRSILLEWSVRS